MKIPQRKVELEGAIPFNKEANLEVRLFKISRNILMITDLAVILRCIINIILQSFTDNKHFSLFSRVLSGVLGSGPELCQRVELLLDHFVFILWFLLPAEIVRQSLDPGPSPEHHLNHHVEGDVGHYMRVLFFVIFRDGSY